MTCMDLGVFSPCSRYLWVHGGPKRRGCWWALAVVRPIGSWALDTGRTEMGLTAVIGGLRVEKRSRDETGRCVRGQGQRSRT